VVDRLEQRIGGLGSAIVAFSGGVDSSLVAALAARALGENALAITAISPALAHGELDGAQRVAEVIGIAHETITTDELASEDYRRNDRYRCFHCKTELYGRLTEIASERGYGAVLSGANADDAGDWRPGLKAAEDHGVIHPLLEAGVTKRQVRELASELGVPSADKPASPCLASRIPYGTAVERSTLQLIDAAERAVKQLGFRELRVRHYGELGRLEVGADELARATREREAIERAIRGAGYDRAEIDPKPFRSGSLNELPMLA
jgi:uncharacterized protein